MYIYEPFKTQQLQLFGILLKSALHLVHVFRSLKEDLALIETAVKEVNKLFQSERKFYPELCNSNGFWYFSKLKLVTYFSIVCKGRFTMTALYTWYCTFELFC